MKLFIVLLACVCSLSGCSVTGLVVGAVADGNANDFDTLTTYNRLEPGDEVTIFKNDGSSAVGTIAEPLRHLSFEERVAKIAVSSSSVYDLSTGSFSNAAMPSQKAVSTSIVLRQSGNEDARIPLGNIQHIVIPHKKNAALTGLVVGAAIDIVIAVIISNEMKGMFRGGWGTGSLRF